jgi:hypothetical protein
MQEKFEAKLEGFKTPNAEFDGANKLNNDTFQLKFRLT